MNDFPEKPDANGVPEAPVVPAGRKTTQAKRKAQAKGQTAKKPATKQGEADAKRTPWTFPKNTLEESIAVAKAIEDKFAGNPVLARDLAKAVGFRKAEDWRYQDLLRSANQHNLISGTGVTATVSLTRLGQDVVAPSNPTQRSEALMQAFRNVPQFKQVEEFYGEKRIPEDEFFINTLTREFDIPRERVDHFAKIFRENLKFLRSFRGRAAPSIFPASEDSGLTVLKEAAKTALPGEPRVREFLETCFVMMPFGEWFDRYYQEIHMPAIKEAGFEPMRADELFHTGTVVEQIWEQIQKARILLADLSGKNANVFYELGLAHAARKPVVFTAANIEDVPFDLRHLRVIVYDVRDPEWGTKLRQSISDYLRNAAKDPTKSIPHPFRTLAEEAE